MFNNLRADLKRYVRRRSDCRSGLTYILQYMPIVLFHEGAIALIGYRFAAWCSEHRLKPVAYVVSKLFFFLTGNYIHHDSKIGPGCKINHSAVVIHASQIGKGFECSANVTVGQKVPYQSPFPKIGNYVIVGAGARVLNDLGDEVIVGANAVVIHHIESGRTVAGIPARIINESQPYMEYYKNMISPDKEYEN